MTESDDPLGLDQLWAQHVARLRAWLERRIPVALARRLDADDILQDAVERARSRYESFRGQPVLAPYPWLFGIVRDCYLRQWERHTRDCRDLHQEMPWPEHSSVQLGLGLMARTESPSQVVVQDETRQLVWEVVQMLGPEDRELLAMRYWEGFSFAEIGGILAIREEAARVRHARALKRFRDLWDQVAGRAGGGG